LPWVGLTEVMGMEFSLCACSLGWVCREGPGRMRRDSADSTRS
jgi:hypothetical protein